MKTKVKNLYSRIMIKRDIKDVMRISKGDNENGWSEEEIIAYLRSVNNLGIVMEDKIYNKVVGFCIYHLDKDHIRLAEMAVDPRYSRKGIGSELLNILKSKLTPDRRTALVFDVRETNLDAHLFLKEQKFKAVKVLKNWFDKEDAYRFVWSLE
jgi:ribosomal protein S18 acetylase RimI-like enzyme